MLFLIVLGGIGIGVTGGAVCGLAVPYLLHLMSRDPQVAAGPIALASADVIVLLAYFNLALLAHLTPFAGVEPNPPVSWK